MEHRFQINLSGIIDLLSNHLYSSPSVYIRELLQNGVDAIRAREELEAFEGRIHVEVGQTDQGDLQLMFRDNGIGLTEDETHQFLSTIGESSKRGALNRADFIGQFGIGLLSNFIVSDELMMVTRSARETDSEVVQWRGRRDGTYDVSTRTDSSVQPGTTVFLKCKTGSESWFAEEKVFELLERYGALLPYPIEFTSGTSHTVVNEDRAPWLREFENEKDAWKANMEFGRRLFDTEFFDCIPLQSEAGEVDGVAYVLPYSPNPTAPRAHRVYLKGMLLTESSENLLPRWAFFVTCVVNTQSLRPVASREAFYEDATLQETREALGESLRGYLIDLKRRDPRRLKSLISIHSRAIKALAVHDDEFYRMFIDLLSFETSLGRMPMGQIRAQFGEPIRYVPSVDAFRQIAQVAASQSVGVINAGYSYDADLVERLGPIFGSNVSRIDSSDLAETFEELEPEALIAATELLEVARMTLEPFQCMPEVKRFKPDDVPALYLAGDDAQFIRSLEKSQDVADDHWSSILSNLAQGSGPDANARLCLNFNSPLVQKLTRIDDIELLRLSIQMLYVQALLLGHHPLKSNEMAVLNTGLIDLIDRGLASALPGGWIQ